MCGCDVRCDVVRAPTISLKKRRRKTRGGFFHARRGEPRRVATPRTSRARGGGCGHGTKGGLAYLSPALYTSILMVMFLPITSWSSTTDCGRGSGGTVRSRDGTRIRDRAFHDRCARARYRLLGLDPELRIARVDIERRTLCTMRCAWEGAASSCATAPVVTSAATSATIATRAKTLTADFMVSVTLRVAWKDGAVCGDARCVGGDESRRGRLEGRASRGACVRLPRSEETEG